MITARFYLHYRDASDVAADVVEFQLALDGDAAIQELHHYVAERIAQHGCIWLQDVQGEHHCIWWETVKRIEVITTATTD
ncbi:MAG: hypothetical protein ACRENP_05715 [Longimicrobiales bacterium]